MRYFLKKYLIIKENVILSERFFGVNSVLNWIYKNIPNQKVIAVFIADLEKYMSGGPRPNWINKVGTQKERENNDNKESKAKEKGRSRE